MPGQKLRGQIYRISQAVLRGLFRVAFGCRYVYEAPIPTDVPLIVASNHASYFDPPGVGAGVPRPLNFMAKRELFRNPLFGGLIGFYGAVPIRRGVMDWRGVAMLKGILAAGGAVLLFPEGTRSRNGELGEAKFGAGMLAQESGALILPAYIRGSDQLKAAFLRRRTMLVRYGEPISPQEYAGFERSVQGRLEISRLVMARIAGLKERCGDGNGRVKLEDTAADRAENGSR